MCKTYGSIKEAVKMKESSLHYFKKLLQNSMTNQILKFYIKTRSVLTITTLGCKPLNKGRLWNVLPKDSEKPKEIKYFQTIEKKVKHK